MGSLFVRAGQAMTRPPVSNDHSRAFAIIFAIQMAIVIPWTAWVISAQLDETADAVRELRVP